MMLTNLALLALAAAPADSLGAEWQAPSIFVAGGGYVVSLTLRVGEDGAELPVWALTPAAFSVGGNALGERGAGVLPLAGGTELDVRIDIGAQLAALGEGLGDGFQITWDGMGETEATSVDVWNGVGPGLDFMSMEPDQLDDYWVVMVTNRGTMVMEFWPDVAPATVRNFLDLCYTGFYEGLTFHRVIPNFMIQGGDPSGTGSGSGPRKLQAEFSDRKHVPGVLSMARLGHDVNSATSQFFVMHAAYPSLDGQYTAFGKLVSGLDVVDRIVKSPRNARDKPNQPQVIEKTFVVKARAKAPETNGTTPETTGGGE